MPAGLQARNCSNARLHSIRKLLLRESATSTMEYHKVGNRHALRESGRGCLVFRALLSALSSTARVFAERTTSPNWCHSTMLPNLVSQSQVRVCFRGASFPAALGGRAGTMLTSLGNWPNAGTAMAISAEGIASVFLRIM